MKINMLAIAAHPDDAELSCSGTLILHKQLGYTTGIIDLTQGELGSRGSIEIRKQESEAATKILDLDVRENLKFRDGFFLNDEKHQIELIKVIRKYKPDIVLANAPTDRHPDHGRAASLIKDACFYSGLVKIETAIDGKQQEAWRPKKIFNYIQDQYLNPDVIIDISSVIEQKMESVKAYKSQFMNGRDDDEPITYISSEEYTQRVLYRNNLLGKKIGVKYGEGFLCIHNYIGLKDFSSVILPDLV